MRLASLGFCGENLRQGRDSGCHQPGGQHIQKGKHRMCIARGPRIIGLTMVLRAGALCSEEVFLECV